MTRCTACSTGAGSAEAPTCQKVAALDYRQTLFHSFDDLIVVGAQPLPRTAVPIRPSRPYSLDHRADQLIGELIKIAITIQPPANSAALV